MRMSGPALLTFCLLSSQAVADPSRPPGEQAGLVGRLSQELNSQPSATAVLETWCGARHMADPPKVTARLAVRADQAPPAFEFD